MIDLKSCFVVIGTFKITVKWIAWNGNHCRDRSHEGRQSGVNTLKV